MREETNVFKTFQEQRHKNAQVFLEHTRNPHPSLVTPTAHSSAELLPPSCQRAVQGSVLLHITHGGEHLLAWVPASSLPLQMRHGASVPWWGQAWSVGPGHVFLLFLLDSRNLFQESLKQPAGTDNSAVLVRSWYIWSGVFFPAPFSMFTSSPVVARSASCMIYSQPAAYSLQPYNLCTRESHVYCRLTHRL